MVRSFSKRDRRTHWWNFTSSSSTVLLFSPDKTHTNKNCTHRNTQRKIESPSRSLGEIKVRAIMTKTFSFSSMQLDTTCICHLFATHWMCLCLCGSWITKQQLLPPPFPPLKLIHAASSARKLFSENLHLLLRLNFAFSALNSHCNRLYWFGNFLCTKKKNKHPG